MVLEPEGSVTWSLTKLMDTNNKKLYIGPAWRLNPLNDLYCLSMSFVKVKVPISLVKDQAPEQNLHTGQDLQAPNLHFLLVPVHELS